MQWHRDAGVFVARAPPSNQALRRLMIINMLIITMVIIIVILIMVIILIRILCLFQAIYITIEGI